LNTLGGKFTLMREVLDYIKKNQRIYKRELREAKKERQ
jgi:molybdopterin synthase catalytic subunit